MHHDCVERADVIFAHAPVVQIRLRQIRLRADVAFWRKGDNDLGVVLPADVSMFRGSGGVAPRLGCPCTRCLAPGDDLERSWLEAVEYLAEPCHPFLVAGEGTPTPDGRHVRPWAEADERLRVFQVAEKQRGSFESFAVAPIDPLAPTPDELVLASCPHAPGRVRVRLLHQPLPLAVGPSITALAKNAGCCDVSQTSRKGDAQELGRPVARS